MGASESIPQPFAAQQQAAPDDGGVVPPDGPRAGRRMVRHVTAVGLVAAAHAVVASTSGLIGPAISSVFLGAVLIASLYGGRGPGLLATALAALDLAYAFARPYNSFSVVFDDLLWVGVFLGVALLTSSLQARRRRAEESLRAAHANLERRVRERTAE